MHGTCNEENNIREPIRRKTHCPARDRIVLALDVDSDQEALALVDELGASVGMFKVGHQLFTAYGPDIVRRIIDKGGRVFLDLKYHDIPNTVPRLRRKR